MYFGEEVMDLKVLLLRESHFLFWENEHLVPTQITEKMNRIPDPGYKSHREREMLFGILLHWLSPASQSPLQTLRYPRNTVHFGDWKKRRGALFFIRNKHPLGVW